MGSRWPQWRNAASGEVPTFVASLRIQQHVDGPTKTFDFTNAQNDKNIGFTLGVRFAMAVVSLRKNWDNVHTSEQEKVSCSSTANSMIVFSF